MDYSSSLMYFGEIRVGLCHDQPTPSLFEVPCIPEYTMEANRLVMEGDCWVRTRTTTVETTLEIAQACFSSPIPQAPILVDAAAPVAKKGLWSRFLSWCRASRDNTDHVADVGRETRPSRVDEDSDDWDNQPGAAGVTVHSRSVTQELVLTRWTRELGPRLAERELVRSTTQLIRSEEAERRVFGDDFGSSVQHQTYKKFVEHEYRRGRKRGTRGKQRPYRSKRVEYCSLLENACRLMAEPGFRFTDPELADVYRELMAIHRREGCELGFASGANIVYEKVAAGSHEALVATFCREITRPGSGFVQGQFQMVREEVGEDLRPRWLIHWAATEARTRPTVWQRFVLRWWEFKQGLGFSAPLPPRQ